MNGKSKKRRKIPWLLILGILIAVWMLRVFCVESYRMSPRQMENSLVGGDHLWVWKFSYGIRLPQTPLSLPFFHDSIRSLGIRSYLNLLHLPQIRIGKKHPDRNDVVVYNIPGSGPAAVPVDRLKIAVGRCIGLPGDTIYMKEGILHINGKEFAQAPLATEAYLYKDSVRADIEKSLDISGIVPAYTQQVGDYFLCLLTRYDYYRVRNILEDPESLYPARLDRNDFSIILPRSDKPTLITRENAAFMASLIKKYEDKDVIEKRGRLYYNGDEISVYRFKQPYYWILADNREMGNDSRQFGVLPHSYLIGKGAFVWLSFDPAKPFYNSLRTEQLFKTLYP